MADNGEWKQNPARAAIIIGTVDMIGSKLLFSGYGDGRYGRAHHAGLVGQDALFVHDEAHLESAFDELLTGVVKEQHRMGEPRPIRVMRLSATTRGGGAEHHGGTDANSPFGIDDDDRQDQVVSQRLGARKSLTIIDADKGKVVARIAEEALRLGASPSRVLVYVRSPEDVARITEIIEKKLDDGGATCIAKLTGTIRGKERNELAESEVFRAFKAGSDRSSPLPHSLYLVSTSAGEVGVDLDADHLVCDLTTLDSMAQRFGRVNRLGGDGRQSQIVIVIEGLSEKKQSGKKSDDSSKGKNKSPNSYEVATEKTGAILRKIVASGGSVSPAALGLFLEKLTDEDKKVAFSPVPTILPVTDILFDHWSLTSIAGEMPGRPQVEPHLHGVADWEPSETHVAWRADITLLAAAGGKDRSGKGQPCSHDDIGEVFNAFPLHSTEQLRDRTDRVQAALRKIAERLKKQAQHQAALTPADNSDSEELHDTSNETEGGAAKGKDTPIEPNPWVVLMRNGSVKWVRLEDIAPSDKDDAKRAQRSLSFATVVLPAEVGGLKEGMLDGYEPAPADARSLDVGEVTREGVPARHRVIVKGDVAHPLLRGHIANGVTKAIVILVPGDEDAEPVRIEYRVARGQDREPGERVELSEHNDAVAAAAERIGRALGLDDQLVTALRIAGRWHDAGKARAIWQGYANNPNGAVPIAKSDRYGHWKQLAGYRHEFGSLHDAASADEIRSLDTDTRDLVLHLIAAHHGWARPYFEPRHFDPGEPPRAGGKPRPTADSERLAVEAMQRFARLQQRYGRWGLAWLESILRCADAAGSESSSGGAA